MKFGYNTKDNGLREYSVDIEIAHEYYWKFGLTDSEEILYCSMLEIDGKKGWRVPSVDEFRWIYSKNKDIISTDIDFDEIALEPVLVVPIIPVRDL